MEIVYKEAFSVIGIMGEGTAAEPSKWILPLWEKANSNFLKIEAVIKKKEDGSPYGVWGAMNDVNEQNKRWDESGRYMAAYEADIDAKAPEGFHKWIIPAQTYLVLECTLDTYGEVFGRITTDENIQITGTVHEYYTEPGNPSVLQLYFPIADGMLFCGSCGMPLTKTEELGTEADGRRSMDYCCYCYENGAFKKEETMEEMIETCIPFVINGNPYKDADEARKAMLEYFPQMKRWKR